MWLLALVAIGAVLGVLAARGNALRLIGIPIMGGWMLFAGAALQVALEYIAFAPNRMETTGYGLLMTSYVFLLAFAFTNFPLRGMGLIALGIALNTIVIGLNLGMPTRPVGLDDNGNRIEKPIEQSVKHRPQGPDDVLGFLGDKILPPKPINELISVGDIVLILGVAELAYFGSRNPLRRRRRRRRHAHRRSSSAPRRSSARSSAASTRPSYT